MDPSELVATEILKFLTVDDRLAASRIDQRWFRAGSSATAWVGSMPLATSYDGGWLLPSPRTAMDMVRCSHVEPLCAAVSRLRVLREAKDPLGSEVAAALEASLAGIALLHERRRVSGTDPVSDDAHRKRFLLQKYFPTLLWVLFCAEVPQQLHIRKSRGDEAEDEAPIGLWDLCYAFLAAPELPSSENYIDLEIIRAVISVFHFFRISSLAVGLFLQKFDTFDAPVWFFISCLDGVRSRHHKVDSQTMSAERLVIRQLLTDVQNTIDCIDSACADALRLYTCDDDTQRRLLAAGQQLASLRVCVDREYLRRV